jgi:hypothetical protein
MFHVKNGLWFERTENGSVHLVKKADARDNAPVMEDIVIDDSSWASIVATVSAQGETGETYREALAFHNRATA